MNSIELKSPEIHEILNRPPKGLVRWGSSLLFGLLLTFFTGSYLFQYPEVVNAKVTVTTTRPPVWLTARATATIRELHGKHLLPVTQGQLIAVLENPATTAHVLFLKAFLTDSSLYRLDTLTTTPRLFDRKLNLGDIQPYWTSVVNRFIDYYLLVSIDNPEHRKRVIQSELRMLNTKLKTLHHKLHDQERDYTIQQNHFRREKALSEKGIIAPEAFEQAEQELLSSQQSLNDIRLSVNSLMTEKNDLTLTLDDELMQHHKTRLAQEQAYYLALKELASAIETWEQTYLLISPLDGILTFPNNRNTLQQIQTGDKLFAVIPSNPGPLQAYLQFPATNYGKVQKGQTVRIFLDGYPYLEFGTLGATIHSISLMPDADSNYTAIAFLPDSLQTNYGKRIDLQGELSGTAQIRTKELRLIERIINPLKYLLKSQQ